LELELGKELIDTYYDFLCELELKRAIEIVDFVDKRTAKLISNKGMFLEYSFFGVYLKFNAVGIKYKSIIFYNDFENSDTCDYAPGIYFEEIESMIQTPKKWLETLLSKSYTVSQLIKTRKQKDEKIEKIIIYISINFEECYRKMVDALEMYKPIIIHKEQKNYGLVSNKNLMEIIAKYIGKEFNFISLMTLLFGYSNNMKKYFSRKGDG